VKEQLRILCKLQALEQRKRLLSNQKANCDAGEVRQLWQDIRLLGQSLVVDKEKLVCLEKVCARQEDDLLSASKHCQMMETKLYGGEITNLKELDQMKAKCESLRKDVAEREDEVVANMEYYEQLREQIVQSETLLQEKKLLHAEKQIKLSQDLTGFDAQIAVVNAEYNLLSGKVEPVLMSNFKNLERKLTQPVATIENGVCSGCRRSIPTNQLALTQTSVVQCDNCGRFLLVD
jgi:predicted  nucleic acid-binding Zn-ribbon protein